MQLVERATQTWSDSGIAYKGIWIALLVVVIQRFSSRSKPRVHFPIWATLEIAITSYFLGENGWGRRLVSRIRRYGGSLYGVSSRHQMLVNLSDVDRLMAQPHHTIDAIPVQYTLLTRVFGAKDTPLYRKKILACTKDLNSPVEQVFLNEAATIAALERANIPLATNSFVTFSSSSHDKRLWEKSANIRLIDSSTVEADLHSLSRDFGLCIAAPLFYGSDFLNRAPTVIEDLWRFDNDLFPLMVIGVPTWAPFKIVKEGIAARSRLHQELEGLYKRIAQYQHGEPVDFNADMSDVSKAALGRSAVYERDGFSLQERGQSELGIYWGQNANTQPMVFWLLLYIYSNPKILERVREEISPYVELSESSSGVEITGLQILALTRHSQFFKACLFETYRLANEPTSIRYVNRPITINDGEHKHKLKTGTFISAPHTIIQSDPSIFSDPEKFIPERFLEVHASSGKKVARYGKLKPWGSGAAMCKGRTFAEKEILSLVAAIISAWDIRPAEGEWRLPAMVPGAGTKRPVNDIRVVISKRVAADS